MWLEVCPKVCFSMSHPLSCPKKALADIFEHNGWVNCHLAIMLLSCPAFSWTTDVVAIASRPMSISKNQFVLPLVYCTVPLTKKMCKNGPLSIWQCHSLTVISAIMASRDNLPMALNE